MALINRKKFLRTIAAPALLLLLVAWFFLASPPVFSENVLEKSCNNVGFYSGYVTAWDYLYKNGAFLSGVTDGKDVAVRHELLKSGQRLTVVFNNGRAIKRQAPAFSGLGFVSSICLRS